MLWSAGSGDSGLPNILVLVTDDQRWDAMGCAGNAILQTPATDRLAQEGTQFTKAFVTSSACAASRATIFTGQYERAHGCNFHTGPLRRAQPEQSYPARLRRAGYYTGFIGKYGVGDGKRDIEGHEVFDRWYGFYGQGEYFPPEHGGKHLSQVMVEQACDFLEHVPLGRPWCLSISFKAPHSGKGYLGYDAELDLQHRYAEVEIPMPPTGRQEYFEALSEFLRRSNAHLLLARAVQHVREISVGDEGLLPTNHWGRSCERSNPSATGPPRTGRANRHHFLERQW